MRLCLLLTLAIVMAPAGVAFSDDLPWAVDSLRCDDLHDPLGIDTPRPSLSWIDHSSQNGAAQSAYEIFVASAPEKLLQPDIWDSGKVQSSDAFGVAYAGTPLRFGQECFWKVRAWDRQGHSADSAPGRWLMGPMSFDDFGGARWIGAPPEKARPFEEWRSHYGARTYPSPSADARQWLGVDLGRSCRFDEIRLYGAMPPGNPNVFFPLRFRVECDDDPAFAHPTTLADETAADVTVDATRQEVWTAHFAPATARYARVLATRLRGRRASPTTSEYMLGLAQIQLFDGSALVSAGAAGFASDGNFGGGWANQFLTDGVIAPRTPRTDWPIPPSPLLRKSFAVDGDVARAEVSVTALGEYELRLNGQRVGDHQLAPEWTDYSKRVQYQTYDVTQQLRRGENVIAATLGDGWYAGTLAGTRWSSDFPRRGFYGLNRRLLLRLDIQRVDGTKQTIVTDGTWKIDLDGPIRQSDHFLGEIYDARKEVAGWDEPGFTESAAWRPVAVDDSIETKPGAQLSEPIRIVKTLKPVSLSQPKPGLWVFKLPEEISGWCRIRLDGPSGTVVTLHHAEWLKPDGTLFMMPLGGARSVDQYILDGKGPREFEPHFTYHGFQYVSVEGLPNPPALDSLEGRVVSSDVPPAGEFECSDPLLNRIWLNAYRTQRSNTMSVPTDCPSRNERYGYGGDALSFSDCAIFNRGMEAFYAKWLRDWRDSQYEGGFLGGYAPYPYSPALARDRNISGWDDAFVQVTYKVYQRYGDTRVIRDNYDAMKRWLGVLAGQTHDFILSGPTCGDWLSQSMIADVPGYPHSGPWTGVENNAFSTMFYFTSTREMAAMARAVGNDADAQFYGRHADQIRDAFNRHFVTPDGKVAGDNQSTYALALYFDILPENIRPLALRHLLAWLDAYEGRLGTGIIATPKLFEVLTRFGQSDRAYALMKDRRFPSLGYEIDRGATTVWERWDNILPDGRFNKDDMQSFQHVALGGHAAWLYTGVLGINPDADSPAFTHFYLKPQIGGGVTWARGQYKSIRGVIASSWTLDGEKLTMDVQVPVGSTATVYVPTGDSTSVTENGSPAASAVAGAAVFDVPSGQYTFSARR